MDVRPTEDDGRRGLRDHALERAHRARARYGPQVDADAVLRCLDDREIVRYPVGVRFASDGLQLGEMAHAEPLADHPRQGFCLFIHPSFEAQRDAWPLIIAYYIPSVNYGDIVEPEDCEAFGAALLGMDVESYYQQLCALADSIA